MGEHIIRHDPIRPQVLASWQKICRIDQALVASVQPDRLMVGGVSSCDLDTQAGQDFLIAVNSFEASRGSKALDVLGHIAGLHDAVSPHAVLDFAILH